MTIPSISPETLAELCRDGNNIELIDVRAPIEYREVHVDNAWNVPLDELDPAALMQARQGSANEPLYFICRSGSRGNQACERFVKAGLLRRSACATRRERRGVPSLRTLGQSTSFSAS